MKFLWLLFILPSLAFSQGLYQGQGNSSDDNPPGLEEAWKYKYSKQGSFRSPYGNLENEIPESYGNSPSRMGVNGKGHATKCRPKQYRQTFELPPEAFADFCEAKMGKSYKEEKAKAAHEHYANMIQKYYGNKVAKTGSFKHIKGNQRNRRAGGGNIYDPRKYIIESSADLPGALEAAKQGKEIHDHRNGHKGCYKCHSKKVAAKKHQEMKEIEKFQKDLIKNQGKSFQKMLGSYPAQAPKRYKKRCTSCGRGAGSSARRPASKKGSVFTTKKKPELGYSYTHSKGSSVLINYDPNKKNKGGTKYEWGTRNK